MLTRIKSSNIENSTIKEEDLADSSVSVTKLKATGAASGHVLQVNFAGELEFVAPPLPTIYLDEICDVDVSTASVGQALVYNGINWVASTISGGSGGSGATILNDLLDVTISAPTTGQVLRYNGTLFVNSTVSYTDIAGKPTIPTNGSFTLLGLNDTSDTAVPFGILRWNSTGTGVDYSTTLPASTISGLSTVAISGAYNDLSGRPVLSTVAISGQYNDLIGKPALIATKITELTDATATAVNNGYLRWNASGTQVVYQAAIPSTSVSGLSVVATSGLYNDLSGKPILSPVATVGTLAALTDVNLSGVNNGQVLTYNLATSKWIPTTPVSGGGGGSTDFVSLTDTNDVVVPNGFLRWNGSGTQIDYTATISSANISGLSLVATSGSYGDLSSKPTIPSVLDDLSNVNAPSPSNGQVLSYNGSQWIASSVAGSGESNTASNTGTGAGIFYQKVGIDLQFKSIKGTGSVTVSATSNEITVDVPSSPTTLTGMSDVNIASPLNGQSLVYNTTLSKWTNQTISGGAGSFIGLSDTNDTPLANGFLRWNATGDNIVYQTLSTVATTGAYSDLTGKPALATVATSGDYVDLVNKPVYSPVASSGLINDLNDVTITTPATNQGLIYNGSQWVNGNLSATVATLDDIGDVALSGLAAGHSLQYNGTQWVNSSSAIKFGQIVYLSDGAGAIASVVSMPAGWGTISLSGGILTVSVPTAIHLISISTAIVNTSLGGRMSIRNLMTTTYTQLAADRQSIQLVINSGSTGSNSAQTGYVNISYV